MRISSASAYDHYGLPAQVNRRGKNQVAKAVGQESAQAASSKNLRTFSALLSEAETKQLIKLFGRFDPLAIAPGNSNPGQRPGQIIDITV